MHAFEYLRPRSLEQASSWLRERGADTAVLAGGTDLIVQMAKGRRRPAYVLDLKRIEDLPAKIEATAEGLRIGALARLSDIVEHPVVRRRFPALHEAARSVGSVQIRNRATLAGNLCNASPAADTAPALLVYGARVNVFHASGRRTIPLDAFFAGPGKTRLETGEIVESVVLPLAREATGSAFLRLSRRRGMDLASVSVACRVEGGRCVRFGLGAVGPTPILATADVPAPLDGDAERTIETLVEQAAARAQPVTDIRAGADYRRAMVAVLCRRTLATALRRLKEEPET